MIRRPPSLSARRAAARPADRGFSLIELVLAMALFALVAVMGSQALTGMIRMRGDLEDRSTRTAALAEVTSLLRSDLNALIPMLFYPPERAPPEAALRLTRQGGGTLLALSRGGIARFGDAAGPDPERPQALSSGRIEWRLHNGRLRRSYWPSLIPADPRLRLQTGQDFGAELGGISALRLRSYWPQTGWVQGSGAPLLSAAEAQAQADSDSAATASEVYSDSLPLAVELTLVTGHFGEISLVESLK